MKPNELEALRLFAKLTGGSFDAWKLAGSDREKLRQAVLERIEGFHRPEKACRVTLLKNQLVQLAIRNGFEMPQACIAVQDARLAQWFALRLKDAQAETADVSA